MFLQDLHKQSQQAKNDAADFVKKIDFDDKLKNVNKKVTSNKTKHLLVENEFKKLQTFGSRPFISQSYFNNDGAQLYSVFQPIDKTTTTFSNHADIISEWESKGLPNENIVPPFTISKSLSPKLIQHSFRKKLKFKGSCLKHEDKTAVTPKNVVNLFTAYELDTWSRDLDIDFTLKYCLFRSINLNKNTDKYKYSGYGIGFALHSTFSLHEGSMEKNAIIFGADMSSSILLITKKKIS